MPETSTPLPTLQKTVAELAALCGGRVEGDGAYVIDGAATLDDAGPKDISFLGNPKYAEAAAKSAAGALFIPATAASLATAAKNRILVDDPQYAFSLVLGLIDAARPKSAAGISPKADVHHQAKLGPGVSVGAFSVIERAAGIGEGTVIGPQCFIGENARIGRFCKIYPQVVIRENCVIGDRVIIQAGTIVGGDGFGFSPDRKTGKLRKIPQIGNVVVGDDVELGANVAIDRASVGSTKIGPGTKIDNLVQVAHGVKIGRDCIIVSQAGIAGSTELGNNVVLGGQVGLVGHIKLGDGVQVGAQSGIMADVPAGTVMFGYPARPHRESFKLQALYGRLPELHEALKEIKQKLGIPTERKAKTQA